ncbi:MAG TPA: amino acid ABC transporter permease [Candidatus Acidoferrum sp.]|nr:amino acid ABC transporter permease [Candidatus Acidoferrum sp.]
MDLLNLEVAREYLGVLLQGLAITVFLTLIVIAMSAVLAIPVALARMSNSRLIRLPVDVYVEVARATPLLLQLIYIYYVLPSIGIRLPQMLCAFIGLTFNYTAYMSEVYRGGINAVAQGQWLAAAALGMTDSLAFRRIILPQAVRIVIPSLGNYFISLFKDTALCSVVGVQELLFKGQIISARSFQYFTIYTLTGILYFSVGYPAAIFVRWLERLSSRGYSRRKRK